MCVVGSLVMVVVSIVQVTDILGYWKTDTMLPGSRLQTHNHCWNAVKVNGRWRLFDLFWAVRSVRSGVEIPFYVSPEVRICSPSPPSYSLRYSLLMLALLLLSFTTSKCRCSRTKIEI
jgi:hypothetical protein